MQASFATSTKTAYQERGAEDAAKAVQEGQDDPVRGNQGHSLLRHYQADDLEHFWNNPLAWVWHALPSGAQDLE